MAHGANNVYENGRNFLEDRTDIEGPVRKGYQEASKLIGGGTYEGNMAYGAVDLATSAVGIFRKVVKRMHGACSNTFTQITCGLIQPQARQLWSLKEPLTHRLWDSYTRQKKTVLTSDLFITAIHLFTSLVVIWLMRSVSIRIFGPFLKPSYALAYIIIAIFLGTVQWTIAREGCIIFLPSSQKYIYDNVTTRWIALISIFIQSSFCPDKDASMLWFRRRK